VSCRVATPQDRDKRHTSVRRPFVRFVRTPSELQRSKIASCRTTATTCLRCSSLTVAPRLHDVCCRIKLYWIKAASGGESGSAPLQLSGSATTLRAALRAVLGRA